MNMLKYLSHLASKEYLKKIVLRFTTVLGKGEIHIVLGGGKSPIKSDFISFHHFHHCFPSCFFSMQNYSIIFLPERWQCYLPYVYEEVFSSEQQLRLMVELTRVVK